MVVGPRQLQHAEELCCCLLIGFMTSFTGILSPKAQGEVNFVGLREETYIKKIVTGSIRGHIIS